MSNDKRSKYATESVRNSQSDESMDQLQAIRKDEFECMERILIYGKKNAKKKF